MNQFNVLYQSDGRDVTIIYILVIYCFHQQKSLKQ